MCELLVFNIHNKLQLFLAESLNNRNRGGSSILKAHSNLLEQLK